MARIFSFQLKRRMKQIKGSKDFLKLVLNYRLELFGLAVSIQPVQVKEEIEQLLDEVSNLHPKIVLEIGTANGGTLFLWSCVAQPDATIISLDLPGGPFGGGYNRWRAPLYRSFAAQRQKIVLLRKDSHSPGTKEEVKNILGGREVDFLFIDGDHSYEGVKKDFEMYSTLVKRGGIVALHDVVPHDSAAGVGVPIFWKEIRNNFKHVEFVKDWNQGSCGIGLVHF